MKAGKSFKIGTSRCARSGAVARVLALLLLFTASGPAKAQQASSASVPGRLKLSLDPAQSTLNWTLGSTLHTVHGTFALKRSEMHVDLATGTASGEFVADATSGKSGNDSRDRKMHNEILDSPRYTDVVFRPARIEGKILLDGTSTLQIHGTFVLHGSEHEITVPVQAELMGNRWKGSSKFTIPYVEWGLKSASTFFLKADPVVDIELELTGELQGGSGS